MCRYGSSLLVGIVDGIGPVDEEGDVGYPCANSCVIVASAFSFRVLHVRSVLLLLLLLLLVPYGGWVSVGEDICASAVVTH